MPSSPSAFLWTPYVFWVFLNATNKLTIEGCHVHINKLIYSFLRRKSSSIFQMEFKRDLKAVENP